MLEPFAPENEVMFGTTVTPMGADTGLVPVASALVAVKLCAPFDNALASKAHAPLLFAVVAPRSVVPSNTFTVLFAPAVPTNISSLTSVISVTNRAGIGRDRLDYRCDCQVQASIDFTSALKTGMPLPRSARAARDIPHARNPGPRTDFKAAEI
jgi:hypothetical protein